MTDKTKPSGRHFTSKGVRISSKKTGRLCSLVDLKQLKLIKPNTSYVHDYEKAEGKRAHMLEQSAKTNGFVAQYEYNKGKKVKVFKPVPSAHRLVFQPV